MTRSAAVCLLVNGFDDGRLKLLTVAAAAVRMLLSYSWSGSGSDLGFGGVYHFSILGVGGAHGGHGVGHGRPVDVVVGESGGILVPGRDRIVAVLLVVVWFGDTTIRRMLHDGLF